MGHHITGDVRGCFIVRYIDQHLPRIQPLQQEHIARLVGFQQADSAIAVEETQGGEFAQEFAVGHADFEHHIRPIGTFCGADVVVRKQEWFADG